MRYKVLRTEEFDEWLRNETLKSQVQIEKRIVNIEIEGHFGIINDLEDNILELKWKNGRRVYYVHLPITNVLLLLGGNKNGQTNDIQQAKKIFKKYVKHELRIKT